MRNLSILVFAADTLCGSATGIVIMAVVQKMILYCGRSCRVRVCAQFLLHQGHIERNQQGRTSMSKCSGDLALWLLGCKIIQVNFYQENLVNPE